MGRLKLFFYVFRDLNLYFGCGFFMMILFYRIDRFLAYRV